MKKLLLILLCVPFVGLGQCISGDCENGEGIYIYSGTLQIRNGHTYHTGGKYIGEFKNGNHHGKGIYIDNSGNKYVGEFKDGEMYGLGLQSNINGNKYVGEFKDGEMYGLGLYTSSNGFKYVGEFKDGERSGEGTNYWKEASEYHNMPAGSQYEGQWLNDKKHGYGKATYADGTVKEGLWKEGEFIGN